MNTKMKSASALFLMAGLSATTAAETTWVKVASQYQYFTLTSPQLVRFGTDTRWVQKTMSGKIYCGVGSFGSDPAYGVDKECQVASTSGTTPSAFTPACNTFYSNSFTLSSGKTNDPIPVIGKPVKGVTVKEPTYNTCLVRITNHSTDGTSGFARNDYSRRQAFNSDSSKYLIYALDGSWHVYSSSNYGRLKKLSGPAGDAEPQWHPANPDLMYYLPTNGIGMKIHELTVSTNTSRVVADLSARVKAIWPTASAAWTGAEGSPSKDGRYWCFMVDDANWKSLGVITWDKTTDTIVGKMNTNGDRPDHVSMSQSGNYCVVSGGSRGTVAYSRDFSTSRVLLSGSQHSDIGIDASGNDIYVYVDYGANEGDVFMVNINTGVRTSLFTTYISGSATALHVSAKNFNKPGWALISTYADGGGNGKEWLHKKVFAVQLKANPKIYNLAFHRGIYNGYFSAPVASVNRDFNKIIFNSNWNVNTSEDIDAYMVEIPNSALVE